MPPYFFPRFGSCGSMRTQPRLRRVREGMFCLRAEQSISVVSRFERVSSFFALITQ